MSHDKPNDLEYMMALHVTGFLGHVKIAQYLLWHPSCDPTICMYSQEETALHWACQDGHNDVVEELLQHVEIWLDFMDQWDMVLHYVVLAASLSLT